MMLTMTILSDYETDSSTMVDSSVLTLNVNSSLIDFRNLLSNFKKNLPINFG